MGSKQTDVAVKQEMLPAFVAEFSTGAGTEQVADLQGTPPFLYCVQATTKDQDLKDEFGEGGVVIMPAQVAVAKRKEWFDAIPLYFWLSWRQERDYNDKDGGFWLMGSTTNMEDPIAQKARDFNRRLQAYGDGYTCKYVECMNYVIQIDSGPAIGQVTQVTFCKGSYKFGKKQSQYLGRKKPNAAGDLVDVDLCLNRMKLLCDLRKSANAEPFMALEAHPADVPFVTDLKQAHEFKIAYEGFKKLHKAGTLASQEEAATS